MQQYQFFFVESAGETKKRITLISESLIFQLAHNAGEVGFKRMDAFEVLQHVLPANSNYDEKLRKIGRLLVKMFAEGLIEKSENGKRWHITEKGKSELNS